MADTSISTTLATTTNIIIALAKMSAWFDNTPLLFSTQDSQRQTKAKVKYVIAERGDLQQFARDPSGDVKTFLSTFSGYSSIFPNLCHLKSSPNLIKPFSQVESQLHHFLSVWLQTKEKLFQFLVL